MSAKITNKVLAPVFLFGSLVMSLSGCVFLPTQLEGLPLVPRLQAQHQLNIRLQPQSKLFVAFEYSEALAEDQDFIAVLDDIVQQEFGAVFPTSFFTSGITAPGQDWFASRAALAPDSDYIVLLRLISHRSGTFIQSKACEPGATSAKPAKRAFSDNHPFGPVVGVVLSEESKLAIMMATAEQAPELAAMIEPEPNQPQLAHQQLPDKQRASTQVDEQSSVTAPAGRINPRTEDCGYFLEQGRDEIKFVAFVYSAGQQLLLDQSQVSAQAGIFGWQFDTVEALFRTQVQALARHYGGISSR